MHLGSIGVNDRTHPVRIVEVDRKRTNSLAELLRRNVGISLGLSYRVGHQACVQIETHFVQDERQCKVGQVCISRQTLNDFIKQDLEYMRI